MDEDIPLPFDLPAVPRKKVSAAFDGGRITSDGGVMLLAQAERRLGIAERLAAVIPDGRDPSRVIHLLPDILRIVQPAEPARRHGAGADRRRHLYLEAAELPERLPYLRAGCFRMMSS
jgi:hypothetical protein